MLVTTNLFPQPLSAPPNTLLDGMEIEADEPGATEFIVPTEPPADEPEWMLIDPWTCEAVREYERRVW
jgi:hypothetical protein